MKKYILAFVIHLFTAFKNHLPVPGGMVRAFLGSPLLSWIMVTGSRCLLAANS